MLKHPLQLSLVLILFALAAPMQQTALSQSDSIPESSSVSSSSDAPPTQLPGPASDDVRARRNQPRRSAASGNRPGGPPTGSTSSRSRNARANVNRAQRISPRSSTPQRSSGDALNLRVNRDMPVLMLQPGFTTMKPGEQSEFKVMLSNPQKKRIDSLRVVLKYDPSYMELISVDDMALIEIGGMGSKRNQNELAKGYHEYSITMEKPVDLGLTDLLTVTYKALEPVNGTSLGFGAYGPFKTTLIQNGMPLMEVGDDVFTRGCIGARASIVDRPDDVDDQLEIWIDDDQWEREVRNSARDASGDLQTVALALRSEHDTVLVDEEFDVQLLYQNEFGLPIDHFDIRLSFDPEVIQVLDADDKNYIRTGINILDGPYHMDFPFNVHIANEVNNRLGAIHYEMAVSSAVSLSQHGRIATIRCRARKVSDFAPIWFERTHTGEVRSSASGYGVNLLTNPETGKTSIRGMAVHIVESDTIDVAADKTNDVVAEAHSPTALDLSVIEDSAKAIHDDAE